MKYLALISELKKNRLTIFSLRDVENLFPAGELKTVKNNLSRWVAEGKLARLRRDLYEFTEPGAETAVPDLYVANRLYVPSYVSLEMALSVYGLIPEVAASVTSVTTRPTRKFKTRHGSFFYRSCRARAFTGYRLMSYEGTRVLLADREKAVADFLYFSARGRKTIDFSEERLAQRLVKKLDWRKAERYARLFNRRTAALMKKLKEWSKC